MRILTSIVSLLLACRTFAGGWQFNNYDYEAQSWKSRVLLNSGTLSGASYMTGTRFMQRSKKWGVRPILGRVNLYLGTDLAAMAVCIINDWRTGNDGPDALNNFVSGDWSEASGLTGNTTSKSLKCNGVNGSLSLADFTTINDIHFAVYNRTATNESTGVMGTLYTTQTTFCDALISNGNLTYQRLAELANATLSVADTNGVGFYVWTRTASNARAVYKEGSAILTSSASCSGTITSATTPLYVHCYNNQGTLGGYTSRTLCYYCAGKGVTASVAPTYNLLVHLVQVEKNRL